MNKYDLEHKLQKGCALYLEHVPTYPITLGDMAQFGYTRAEAVISVLTMADDDPRQAAEKEGPKTTYETVFQTLLWESMALEQNRVPPDRTDDLLSTAIPSFLTLLFRRPVSIRLKEGFSVEMEKGKEPFYVNGQNFPKLRRILMERNCLIGQKELAEEENPDSAMAKALLKKQKLLRQKVKRLKRAGEDEEDPLTMADLISIFAEAVHMPLQDVYDHYDVYQFNNQFNRLKIMDDFHVNIQALLAGANREDVKLRHWLTKIEQQ